MHTKYLIFPLLLCLTFLTGCLESGGGGGTTNGTTSGSNEPSSSSEAPLSYSASLGITSTDSGSSAETPSLRTLSSGTTSSGETSTETSGRVNAEPSTLILIGIGLAGIASSKLKKKNKK